MSTGLIPGTHTPRDALAVAAAGADWAAHGWRVPSRATINRILARHGLLQANPRKRPRASWRRFSYAQPRDCYQIDATETTLADGTTVVVFDVLDDCTRTLAACRAASYETTAAAIEAITAAFTEFGAPGIVLSDNGSAFTGRCRRDNAGPTRFGLAVTTTGARLIHSSPNLRQGRTPPPDERPCSADACSVVTVGHQGGCSYACTTPAGVSPACRRVGPFGREACCCAGQGFGYQRVVSAELDGPG